MIRRLESQFIKKSLESMKRKSINRIAKIVYCYLCLKHWLPGWWYHRGLIVHQKRHRTSDSSENVDIKISVFIYYSNISSPPHSFNMCFVSILKFNRRHLFWIWNKNSLKILKMWSMWLFTPYINNINNFIYNNNYILKTGPLKAKYNRPAACRQRKVELVYTMSKRRHSMSL